MKRNAWISKGFVFIFIGMICYTISVFRKGDEHTMTPYVIPHESMKHEGTWLIWPHHYTYGISYRNELEPIWIQMTQALISGEKVHILAYHEQEKKRIEKVLLDKRIPLDNIDFVLAKSDDVWVRDTGPIFAYDKNNTLSILDFSFDGWGKKAPFKKDNKIPSVVSNSKKLPSLILSTIVLEGGAMELDGRGTFMACKSSLISPHRNSKVSQKEMEEFLHQYFGITNFIWLEGSIGEDITDSHIDGIARFYDEETILTVSKRDFYELYDNIKENDYDVLTSAKNTKGKAYNIIELPLTQKNVIGLDYKGSYLNFYIGNKVVLFPIYQDKHDKIVIESMKKLYPDKQIVPIDVTPLYPYGGMLHCITQQQPANKH
ncbi:agmatine deiminase family protein [Amedibacillus sp. YH-ame6]